MSAVPLAEARPLLDVLGARWRVGGPGRTRLPGTTKARSPVSLWGDGSLALAPAAWENGPMLRSRDGGGAELVPATAPAPPVARVPVHQGRCLAVAADPDAGFLTAGEDGQVARVLADGEIRVLAQCDGPVAFIAAGRGGWRACAHRRAVQRFGGAASSIDAADDVTALALDPAGARLAIGYDGGVMLWAGGNQPRALNTPGTPAGLAWTWDGDWLASFTQDGILSAWRLSDPAPITLQSGGTVQALGVLGNAFVAGVGGRVVRWHPGSAETGPQPCGVANQSAVTRVAGHPRRALIAAGYANGTVVLCQPRSTELLFLRAAGEGAVSALGFSPQGDHLAIGTDGGEIAVLSLPDMLFRDNRGSQ